MHATGICRNVVFNNPFFNNPPFNNAPARRRGAVLLLAMIALIVLVTFALVVSYTALQENRKATSFRDVVDARYAAESGLEYALYLMRDCRSEPTLGDLPDMLAVVEDHLAAKVGGSLDVAREEHRIVMRDVPIDDRKACDIYIQVVEETQNPDGDWMASTLQLLSIGKTAAGGATTCRGAGVVLDVVVDKELLHYAVASAPRLIIRGNVQIDGDLCTTWRCRGGDDYALDIGNTIDEWRVLEDIRIDGFIGTTQEAEDFEDNHEDDGIRHGDIMDLVDYGRPSDFMLTHEDFDTARWRDRAFTDLDVPLDDEHQRRLDFPDAIPESDDWEKFYDGDNWHGQDGFRRGYRGADGDWIVCEDGDPNAAGTYYWDSGTDQVWFRGDDGEEIAVSRTTDQQDRWLPAYDENDYNDDGEGYYEYQGNIWYNNGDGWYRVYKAPAPDSDQLRYEEWANGNWFWRANYEDYNGTDKHVLKNAYIPQGYNPHFKNCVFEGVTYIATEEDDVNGNFNKYSNDIDGSLPHVYDQGDRAGNNVVFENCTFRGPIVSGVPTDLRWDHNAAYFIGDTVFEGTAIQEALGGVTMMMPNFNINIGDFAKSTTGSDSKIVGLVIGGLVDIRDNALVEGTILAMGNLDHVSDGAVDAWGTNIGTEEYSSEYYQSEDGGFSPTENLVITPDPDNVMPYGIKRKYRVIADPLSFTEVIDPAVFAGGDYIIDWENRNRNRSGLGDGTNPGQGGGTDNSPNDGTDNPGGN